MLNITGPIWPKNRNHRRGLSNCKVTPIQKRAVPNWQYRFLTRLLYCHATLHPSFLCKKLPWYWSLWWATRNWRWRTPSKMLTDWPSPCGQFCRYHQGNMKIWTLLNKNKIQGVSVKVPFSPSMSQGLNLIKYWWSMTLSLPRHGLFCYLTETFM